MILAGSSLQYWSFPQVESEKMEVEEDIGQIVSQAFQRRIWVFTFINKLNKFYKILDLLKTNHCLNFRNRVLAILKMWTHG